MTTFEERQQERQKGKRREDQLTDELDDEIDSSDAAAFDRRLGIAAVQD